MELEVKILDISINEMVDKIIANGGLRKGEYNQIMYMFDLPTLSGRFQEALEQLNLSEISDVEAIALGRIKTVFYEMDNLFPIYPADLAWTNCSSFCEILEKSNKMTILNDCKFIKYMSRMKTNKNKWIRLRTDGKKTTISLKHRLKESNSIIQQVNEYELEVSSFDDANALLKNLGYLPKTKLHKKRISFSLVGQNLDIDMWPEIPPYLEIEGNSTGDILLVLSMLGYSEKDTISCTADEVYRHYGKDIFANINA